MSFQNAKDTFYLALRDRLVVLNADRTIVVRGATRPGLLVEENETGNMRPTALSDAFVLRWVGLTVDPDEAVALEQGRCEVRYATAGMAEVAGMDRGRALQAMDEELLAMLQPATAALKRIDGPSAPVTGVTQVFWSDAVFGDVTVQPDRLERVAIVEVFAWKEEL